MKRRVFSVAGYGWILLFVLAGAVLLPFASKAYASTAYVFPSNHLQEAVGEQTTRFAVMSMEDGQILEGHNANESFQTLTISQDLMTAYLAMESLSLTDIFTVGAELASVAADARTIGLEEGDTVAVRDLLATLLLEGAQDSAVVLAANLAASPEAFEARMNQKAQELGMKNTLYTSQEKKPYSERQDLSDLLTLGRAVLQNHETLAGLLSQAEVTLNQTGNHLPSQVKSRISLFDPQARTYDQRITEGVGFDSSKLEKTILVTARLENQSLLIALCSSLSERRSLQAVAALLDVYEQKPYIKHDSTEEIQALFEEADEQGRVLEPQLAEGFGLYMTREQEASYVPEKLEYTLRNITDKPSLDQHYGDALIHYDGEPIATISLRLAALPDPGKTADGLGQGMVNGEQTMEISKEVVRYTAENNLYQASVYDSYGWIFWTVAAIGLAFVGNWLLKKVLETLC